MIECELKIDEFLKKQKFTNPETKLNNETQDAHENDEDDDFWISFSDESQLKRNMKKITQYNSRIMREASWNEKEVQDLIQPHVREWKETYKVFNEKFQVYANKYPVIAGTHPKNRIALLVLGVKVVDEILTTFTMSKSHPGYFWNPFFVKCGFISCLIKDPMADLFQDFWKAYLDRIGRINRIFDEVMKCNMNRIFGFVNCIVFHPISKAMKAVDKRERMKFTEAKHLNVDAYYLLSMYTCWIEGSLIYDVKTAYAKPDKSKSSKEREEAKSALEPSILYAKIDTGVCFTMRPMERIFFKDCKIVKSILGIGESYITHLDDLDWGNPEVAHEVSEEEEKQIEKNTVGWDHFNRPNIEDWYDPD